MKDLFVGASGRLNNHGGSRMFTTPHTINVPPEYTVETDVPSVAEFVTCSLDGRLWVYRRSRRFYVAAFRWNEDTQRLVFVGTTILSNEAFVMRGADWILTDKSLIQSLDDEPYISRTTYNDSSFLDAIKKSYSFFPEIETWQKIQGEQIIRVDNPPSENLQELTQSLVTPLEFHYYSENNIKAFSEFSPKLCYINGQLYGKGKAHIGRVYLLPRTFSEDGEPEDFYLYISPDYLRSYNGSFDDNDGWENLRVAPFTPESVAIFTPQNNDYSICKKATNAQIFTLPNGESLDLSADNGALFFDALTGSNLALNDKGASLLRDGLSFECKGIRQWIAPSGKVDTISPQLVMSSFDNGTLATHVQGGFHRELLAGKTIPLSTRDYSGEMLSLGMSEANSKEAVQENSIQVTLEKNATNWKDVYSSAISIKLLALKNHTNYFGLKPIYCLTQFNFEEDILSSLPSIIPVDYNYPTPMFLFNISTSGTQEFYAVLRLSPDGSEIIYNISGTVYLNGTIRYIDPNSGEFSDEININFQFPNVINTEFRGENYEFVQAGSILYRLSQFVDEAICVYNGKIGISCARCDFLTQRAEFRAVFIPIIDVPEAIKPYIPDINIPLADQCGLYFNEVIVESSDEDTIAHLGIRNFYTSNQVYIHLQNAFAYKFKWNFPNSNTKNIANSVCNQVMHIGLYDRTIRNGIIVKWPSPSFVVFISELHPEIFDFQSEIERSKLF